MKDLFSGSLGKLNNHGGSRMFTTPNTVYVPPEYEVETDVPSVAEFVTCSLDGRLWVWKRSRRYYVAVFRWNEITQKLVFSGTTIFNNINIIGRGIDWILTDNMIIQVSDDEPYIFTANLFTDNEDTSLYSVACFSVVQFGIVSYTSWWSEWPEDKKNLEMYGLFDRSSLSQPVNKQYSMLPSIGNWNIIGNFLVRKADNPLSDSYEDMLNVRPLILLEFMLNNSTYSVGFVNKISLTCYNGELWGRGLYRLGRCYIMPAVFAEDGTPQEFFLYIGTDYRCSPYDLDSTTITKSDWLNMCILHTGSSLYGFLTEQASNFDNSLCYSSDTPKIFTPHYNEWLQPVNNGLMSIDTINNSGLILNNNGAVFLKGNNPLHECNAIRQWIAPTDKIEAITHDSVISSWDSSTLATHIQQGFCRELLVGKKLHLTTAYWGKRLSLGEISINNSKAIQVNATEIVNGIKKIEWQNIYKPAIDIQLAYCKYHNCNMRSHISAVECVEGEVVSSGLLAHIFQDYNGPIISGRNFDQTLYYFDITSGEFVPFVFSCVLPYDSEADELTYAYLLTPCVCEDKIGYVEDNPKNDKLLFFPVMDIPAPAKPYMPDRRKYSNFPKGNLQANPYLSVSLSGIYPINQTDRSTYAFFYTQYSFTRFSYNVSSFTNSSQEIYMYDFIDSNSFDDFYNIYRKTMHIALRIADNKYMVFFTEYHPEIFNFKAEIERSNLS